MTSRVVEFSDLKFHIVNPSQLAPATIEQVRACERQTGHSFEQNYIDWITRFGSGIFGGTYVRLFSPDEIARTHFERIERYREYYFWEAGAAVLDKAQVLQSVGVGDTFSGDELIYADGGYYVLPRDEEIIYAVGRECIRALEWQLVHNISNEPDEETGGYGHCDGQGAYYFEACAL